MNQTRILVVEDEAIVGRDIAQQLVLLGYKTAALTPQGEQALILAEQLRPDLVLMDIQLAGEMDGISAAQAIRERFAIPVVFLTAFVGDETLERAKVAEPFGYIIKPFQDRELRAVVEMALYKHQAEARLRNSQEEQSTILRTAMDGFCLVDTEGRFLEVNDAYCRLTGYSREELLRMAIRDMEADETPAQIAANIDRIQRLGSARFERRHRCKDGRLVHVEASVNYLPGNGGRLFNFFRDITDRKSHEREIERLNRLYLALSVLNQTIVRVTSREELFREVCRIIAGKAGFKVVWIGWVDRKTHAVNPIARGGDDEGYLDEIAVYADDRPEGGGPVGSCIREHKTIIVDDFLNDPRTAPWHTAAAAHGLRSVTALPIRFHGEVCGALTVYADEPHVFQDKEVALLEEAVAAVTFALESLDREAQRKQSAEVLRDEKDYKQSIIRSMADMLVVVAPDGAIATVNRATCDLLGYTEQELLGQPATLLFEEEEDVQYIVSHYPLPVKRTVLCRLVKEGSVSNVEKSLRTKTGGQIPVLLSGAIMRDNLGGIRGIVCVALDITQRKRLQDEVALRERQLKSFFRGATAGLALFDKDLRYVQINDTLAEMNGLPVEDHLGKTFREVVPWLAPVAEPILQEVLASGEPVLNVELSGKTRSQPGIQRHWTASFFPIAGSDGSADGVGALVVEITQRKRAEERQVRMLKRLESVNLLQQKLLLPGTLEEKFKQIVDTAVVLLDLDFCRVWIAKPGDLCNQGCIHATATEDRDSCVHRDRCMHLIASMGRYTHTDGNHRRVRLTLRCGQHQERRQLVFDVSDTGIGIPADKISGLFKPFSQVDGALTRRYGGTGLGLALSKRLARALGGDITVTSQEGHGSTFSASIDVHPAAEEFHRSPPAVKPEAEGCGALAGSSLFGRLLLVEDDDEVQLVIRHLFQKLNIEADFADNGEVGCQRAKISLIEKKPYDLILMDIQMPVLNGLEATQRLRQEGWTGPIVALTAHAMAEDREKCLKAGCNEYVSKPISQTALQTIVQRYCGARAVAGATPVSRQDPGEAGGLLEGGLLAPEKAARLTEQYAAELPTRTVAINAALDQGDLRTVAILAHQLKGSAGTYGFAQIADMARRLHQEATRPDDVKSIETTVSELQALCRQAIQDVPARPEGPGDES